MTPIKPETRSRRGRLVRADSAGSRFPLPAIERGTEILRLLDAHLYLSNDQIETLLFRHGRTATGKERSPKGAAYAANTALRRLFDAGYVDRIPVFLPGTQPHTVKAHYVNALSTRGARVAAELLKQEGRTPRWRRSLLPHPWQPLLHGFWIRQFAVTGKAACEMRGWRWWSWFDDRQLAALKKEHGAQFTAVPDGFFVITTPETGKDFPHFLEIDLGTETVAARSPGRLDWRGKVESYLDYLDRHFREQFGLASLPIILTVTESEQRLEHLLAATGVAGGGGRFWFTTLARLFSPTDVHEGGERRASDALEGAFWASIWRVPTSSQMRTLASRCGAWWPASEPK
ncbi:MAG: replication-relaxation family protein [Chloroflexota bacterium]|nr:replication-relaxation family protein [Chloroflexota bacterium]MDP9472719.1 replication-relaxation family protein [Chloroflexota bacterium]